MKKIILLAMLAALCSTIVLSGCGEDTISQADNSSSEPAGSSVENVSSAVQSSVPESSVPENGEDGQGDLGDYHVAVLGIRVVNDYQGGKDALIKIKFTNVNDEEAAVFGTKLDMKVYQDGVQLSMGVPKADGYNTADAYKNVKKGASLEFETPVKLSNETSPLEVEIAEYFSWSNAKVTKTLEIPQE